MPAICPQCGKEHATKEELEELVGRSPLPPAKKIKIKKALKFGPCDDET